jgi:hypothetical protein
MLGMPGPFPVFYTCQHLIHNIHIFHNLEIEHPDTDMVCSVFECITETNLGLYRTGSPIAKIAKGRVSQVIHEQQCNAAPGGESGKETQYQGKYLFFKALEAIYCNFMR